MTPRPNNSRDERGVAMLYVAFFMFSSFWLASLALDMGKLMVTKTELQKAADAAALAAASAVDSDTGELIPAVARDRAYEFANANYALREGSERVVIDKNADVDFPKPNQVRVSVHRSEATGNAMTTIFARSLGITHLDVNAYATAEVAPVHPCGLTVPFAPIEPAQSFKMGCGNSYTLTWMPQKGGNKQNSAQASTQNGNDGEHGDGNNDHGDGDDDHGDNGDGEHGGGGKYSPPDAVILDFGDDCNEGACDGISSGPALQDCYLENGYGCCLEEGLSFDTHSGNDLKQVDKSLEDRWDRDTDRRQGICYSDYKGNGKRVLVCPIVTVGGWEDGSGGNGGGGGGGNNGNGNNASFGGQGAASNGGFYGFTEQAKIVGFVSFFLTKKPGPGGKDEVTGHFIQYVVPGDPIKGQPGENVVYGTRLIQNR